MSHIQQDQCKGPVNCKINHLITKNNNGVHMILNHHGFVDFQEEEESREFLEHCVFGKFLVEREQPKKKYTEIMILSK